MVEKARVFVAEDDLFFQNEIRESLIKADHEVVLEASTLAEALKSITQFNALGIQVAIIDGNLSEKNYSGDDGRLLAKKIKELTPQVITIGMSASSTVVGVDINLGKGKIPELGRTITEL